MCEHIVKADFLRKEGQDTPPTPEQIFNYSPNGELAMVWEWFYIACDLIGQPQIEANETSEHHR